MSDKIANNPSYRKIKEQINDIKSIYKLNKLLKIVTPDGFLNSTTEESFFKVIEKYKKLVNSPDDFNTFFSERGWIAHESLNNKLMEESIELGKKRQIEEAESKIINYYKKTDLSYLIYGFKTNQILSRRVNLINCAYTDFKEKRYNSCIPILLMMIDGIVNDVNKSNKGFFAEKADLTAWDSIAGHKTGLASIQKIFNRSRKKTVEDEIDFPFRNGILHGMDLGYGNIKVACKLWNTLFAVKDWALVLLRQKKNNDDDLFDKSKNLTEVLAEIYEQSVITDKMVNNANRWIPRVIDRSYIERKEFEEFSPENELLVFLDNCINNRYGLIAQQFYRASKEEKVSKLARNVRESLNGFSMKEYKIIKIEDKAPLRTDITVEVQFSVNEKKGLSKILVFPLVCDDNVGNALSDGWSKGKWFLTTLFKWELYRLVTENLIN